MKKIFILASAASLLFISCVKNEIDAPETIVTDAPETVLASFGEMTKAHLDGLNVIWNTSDEISVFAKTIAHNKYVLDVLDADNGSSASFKYDLTYSDATETLEKNYAVFPYRPADNKVTADGIVTTRIKNNQDYRSGKLLMSAPMVAVSDGYDFEFQNVASVLRFNVKKSEAFAEECVLNSIMITSKSKTLSGLIDIDTSEEVWTAVPKETSKTVYLKGADINVTLTTEAQPFCIVVPPATYPAGDLTITFTYNTNGTRGGVLPQELNIGANKLQEINYTIEPASSSENLSVTTNGLFEINGHTHLTCYTASVVASVTGGVVSEVGVLCMKKRDNTEDKLKEYLVPENVNKDPVSGSTAKADWVHVVTSELVDDKAICTFTDRVKETSYAYRAYAKAENGELVYGDVKYFKTENYGQFVDVPAGSFTMGANSGQKGYDASFLTSPAHDVSISTGYQIGKYEVSVEEYIKFAKGVNATVTYSDSDKRYSVRVDDKLYWCTSRSLNNTSWDTKYKKYPVDGVTYYGAAAYCEWMTANDDTYEYRLPTEAEWEYAQRGGASSKNYVYSGSNTLSEVAVTGTSSTTGPSYIQRIGEKYPNELGVYDMSGNLWEFVSDRSDKNLSTGYFELCKDGVTDPQGPSDDLSYTNETFYCIVKGGSANEGPGSNAFAVGYRRNDRTAKSFWHNCGGFRIVRVPKAN